MKPIWMFILLGPVLVLGGCVGNMSSIHRDLEISKGKGAFVDVKQRAVLVKALPDENGMITDLSACAEPSPDALSAYAAELAANLSKQGAVDLGVALTSKESSSFIGLRTQTIQLLRDGMYRLCEARMNGISEANYIHLMRRYQRNMVALMAIEQLSGVVKAPTITISAESQASAAQSLNSLREASEEVTTSISNKTKRIKEIEDKAEDTRSVEEKAELTILQADLKELEADKLLIDESIKNARSLTAGGKLTANVVLPQTGSQERISTDIGAKIEALSKEILKQDDLQFMCFDLLAQPEQNNDQITKISIVSGEPTLAGQNITTRDLLALKCLKVVGRQPATLLELAEAYKFLAGDKATADGFADFSKKVKDIRSPWTVYNNNLDIDFSFSENKSSNPASEEADKNTPSTPPIIP